MAGRMRAQLQLATVVVGAGFLLSCGAGRDPWNLLIVTLDTTRADHLGCYGKSSAVTPNVDRIAEEGFLFLRCYTPVPLTTPSHSTIFTGMYPPAHGVRDNGLFVLPEHATTLAELMKEAGWATGAAVGSFPVTREFGLAQGFDYFNDHITVAEEDFRGKRQVPSRGVFFDERPASWVNDAIMPWLDEHMGGAFFAWVHYWDPHHPLVPPPPFSEIFANDLYLGEIAYADQAFGALLDRLRRSGVYERTVIVVVGDHGEGRGEHNEETHSMLVYDSTIRVPLIIRVPGMQGGRSIQQRVGTVDLLPTLAELFDLQLPADIQGRSLVEAMRDEEETPAGVPYYAETLSPRLSHGWGELRALIDGSYKYIHGPRPELYNLDDDPGELQDLLHEMPEVAESMRARLADCLAGISSDRSVEAAVTPDQDTLQRLEALGYVSAGGDQAFSVREELRDDGEAPQDRVGDNSLVSAAKQQIFRENYLAAKESALRLVELDPDNPYYQGMLATAYLGLGQAEEAARIAERAEHIVAQNEGVFMQVAVQLFNGGLRERALALALRLESASPSSYAHYIVGEMYAVLGDVERYRDQLELALAADPSYRPARLSLGILLAQRDEPEAAEAEFLRLLADWPLHVLGCTNYGIFLAHSGRLEEAAAQLERAVRLSPTYWQAQLALLAVYVDDGRTEQARSVATDIRTRCRDERVVRRADELVAML